MLIGATADGKKELLGIADGYRESEESWKELLLDLKRRGLEIDPKLATWGWLFGLLESVAAGVWDDPRDPFRNSFTALVCTLISANSNS